VGRLGRCEFQHHAQVVRQLFGGKAQSGFLVGLRQVHHGGATVARIAVHMLKQVQGGGAAPVKGFYVLRFHLQRVAAAQIRRQATQLSAACSGHHIFLVQHLHQRGQLRAQCRIRVAQQQGQGAQGISLVFHGYSPAYNMDLMGMVRVLLPPNRLVSVAPSEQPLPNEKPQPPRRSNAFSAYSRWLLGMTKRSS